MTPVVDLVFEWIWALVILCSVAAGSAVVTVAMALRQVEGLIYRLL